MAEPLICSFCGKTEAVAEFIVTKPNDVVAAPACICNECVDVCVDIINERRLDLRIQRLIDEASKIPLVEPVVATPEPAKQS